MENVWRTLKLHCRDENIAYAVDCRRLFTLKYDKFCCKRFSWLKTDHFSIVEDADNERGV